MHFKYNSYSHYILGHLNVQEKFAAAGKQSNTGNSNNVNTTLVYQLQSGWVPGQDANLGRAVNCMMSEIVDVCQ